MKKNFFKNVVTSAANAANTIIAIKNVSSGLFLFYGAYLCHLPTRGRVI